MRFGTIGLALLGAVAPDVSAVAQTTPASPAITRTAVAATKLPTVVEVPLYFRAVAVTIPPGSRAASQRPAAFFISSRDRLKFRSMESQKR